MVSNGSRIDVYMAARLAFIDWPDVRIRSRSLPGGGAWVLMLGPTDRLGRYASLAWKVSAFGLLYKDWAVLLDEARSMERKWREHHATGQRDIVGAWTL